MLKLDERGHDAHPAQRAAARGALPPGQREIDVFPRFGLPKYAHRFQEDFGPLSLSVAGDVRQAIIVADEQWKALPHVQQISDFHCVTTWSRRALSWGGVRFADFYSSLVQPSVQPHDGADWVIFRSHDGFRACLPLADLLADDVLLADSLQGAPLSAEHGAPLRLVAPAHYGYKNPKHLRSIEFWRDRRRFRPPAFRFMDHARARVWFEERGRGLPGWMLGSLYRPFVKMVIRRFQRAMRAQKVTTPVSRDRN